MKGYAKYRYKPKKRKKLRKYAVFAVFCIVLCVIEYFYFGAVVNPTIATISQANIKSQTNDLLGSAVVATLGEGFKYEQFVVITYGKDDEIVSLQANSSQINLLARSAAGHASRYIGSSLTSGIKIPIGSLSGIPLLTGLGPNIVVKIIPISSISATIDSVFEASGINQTKHQIMLTIICDITLIISGRNQQFCEAITVLVCEQILVGKVPSTVLGLGSITLTP